MSRLCGRSSSAMRRPIPASLWCLVALGFVVALGNGPARAQSEASPQPPGAAGSSSPTSSGSGAARGPNDPEGILNLDIEQLSKVDVVAPSLNLEVTTVERTESTVGKTPAAIFVITNEMIGRSGARTIPDVLRLAPGVEVQRKTNGEWAIGIRGFNEIYADKLLVQVDGRSVYSPLFGGVWWEVQDMVLEDIERIEVIRGPGGTLWGANAVTGVINIITKSSAKTQGGYVEGGAGTEERGFASVRYGGKLGENATYRLYGKWFDRDPGYCPGVEPFDDIRQARTGFRVDWNATKSDLFTLQGDYYDSYNGTAGSIPNSAYPYTTDYAQDVHASGGNVLGRWTHTIDDDSDWSLQWYYDREEHHTQVMPLVWDFETIDIDFQHRFPLTERQDLIWGCAYRNYSDYTVGVPFLIEFDPAKRADDLFSYFVQDQIEIREDLLYVILGSKFEHNDYTGFEMQPTARVLWTPDEKRCLWAAVSRAVQTPNRLEDNIINVQDRRGSMYGLPVFPYFYGSTAMESAVAIAYEAGMRAQPTKKFYWDLALFLNDYDKLFGFAGGTPYGTLSPAGDPIIVYPLTAVSNVSGETYGFELAGGYELTSKWRMRGAYSFCRWLEHHPSGVNPYFWEGGVPRNQFYLWLSGDLGEHWFLDLIGRYVESLEAPFVPGYFEADARLAYQPRENLEYALVGRNLLNSSHVEADYWDPLGVYTTEVQREVYFQVTYRF